MPIEVWLLFVVTETVLCLSPGPAVLLVLSASLTRGWRPGLEASAGILLANLVYFFLSATSLGAILVASSRLFTLVKWLGAGYLVWLGLKSLLSSADVHNRREPSDARGSASSGMFLRGLVTQGANPKALVFFTALLPQFVSPNRPLGTQILILALTSVLIEFVVLSLYSMLASRASGLARQPRFASLLQRVGGGLLIAAGVGLAGLRQR